MTIGEALKKGTKILKDENIEAPALEAGVILCHAIGCSTVFIYSHGEETLEDAAAERFFTLISKRRQGVPLQHITGHQEFMSLDFTVNCHVLIPRQDTEILVEKVIDYLRAIKKPGNKKTRILDLGTGSGCIAVSLAYYLHNCEVLGIDISRKALEVAEINAAANGVSDRVAFIEGNLFEMLGEEDFFDAIVSNPPYIPTSHIEKLQTEVKDHEPLIALDGGKDGLDFYRTISRNALRHLSKQGILAFEIGYDQGIQVQEIMEPYYSETRVYKDLSGRDRVVTGIKNKN